MGLLSSEYWALEAPNLMNLFMAYLFEHNGGQFTCFRMIGWIPEVVHFDDFLMVHVFELVLDLCRWRSGCPEKPLIHSVEVDALSLEEVCPQDGQAGFRDQELLDKLSAAQC